MIVLLVVLFLIVFFVCRTVEWLFRRRDRRQARAELKALLIEILSEP